MHCRCEHWHLSCNVVDDDFVVDVWLHLKRWLAQSLYICQTFRLALIVHSLALHPQLQQMQHGTMWKFPSLSPWWPKSTQLHWNRPSSCSVHSTMTQSQHPFDFLHFLDDITQKLKLKKGRTSHPTPIHSKEAPLNIVPILSEILPR